MNISIAVYITHIAGIFYPAILLYMDFSEEYRCPNDDKLLFKGLLLEAEVEIKCRHCKQLVTIAPGNIDEIVCGKGGCPNRIPRV